MWRTEIVRHAGKFGELGRPGSFVAAAGFGLRSNAMASGGTVIGFVGTGTMGAPIAGHLVAAGYDVRVHDRSSFAMQAVEGATPVASAAAAASGARCVFLSLPGPADVEQAVTGPDGVLAADPRPASIVDLSTNSPDVVRALHARCAAAGVGFVDAPVSGGRVKAVSGELSVMVGGTANDVAAVEPLLEPFAGQVFHVGPPGAGTVAKLVNNQLFLAAVGARPGGLRARGGGRAGAIGAAPHHPGQLGRAVRGAGAAAARSRLRRRHLPPRHRHQGPHAWPSRPPARRASRRPSARPPSRSTATRSGPASGSRRSTPRCCNWNESAGGDRAAAADEDAAPIVTDGAVAIDLSDDETFRAGFPHDRFAWLRANDPVSWHPPTPRTPDGEGFWVVTRHADVSTVLRDPVTFSSDRGGIREKGGTAIKDERTAGTMLNQTDDPQHQRLRTLVNRGFTPRAVAALTDELHRRGAATARRRRRRTVRLRARLRPRAAVAGDLPRARRAGRRPAGAARLARRRHRGRLAVDPLAGRDAQDPRLRRRADRRQAGRSGRGDHVDDRPRPRRRRLDPHRRRADRLLRPAVPRRRRDDAQRHRRRRARLRPASRPSSTGCAPTRRCSRRPSRRSSAARRRRCTSGARPAATSSWPACRSRPATR